MNPTDGSHPQYEEGRCALMSELSRLHCFRRAHEPNRSLYGDCIERIILLLPLAEPTEQVRILVGLGADINSGRLDGLRAAKLDCMIARSLIDLSAEHHVVNRWLLAVAHYRYSWYVREWGLGPYQDSLAHRYQAHCYRRPALAAIELFALEMALHYLAKGRNKQPQITSR